MLTVQRIEATKMDVMKELQKGMQQDLIKLAMTTTSSYETL